MQYISAFSGTVLHYILADKSLSFVCVVLETALSSTVVLNLFYISYPLLRTDRVQRRPQCVLVYVMLMSHLEMQCRACAIVVLVR